MAKKQQAKNSQKYYVVWKGRKAGIFTSWEETSAQVTGFAGGEYKAFESKAEAEEAFRGRYADYKGKHALAPLQKRLISGPPPILPSYAVDAACAGVPGPVEYRCVNTETGEEIFKEGPFPDGTNNIGEFLAIADALTLLKQKGISLPIYSDSRNAIGWVQAKKCKTQHPPSAANAELFRRIERAEKWLHENDYPNPILKWETQDWGENPADFGRK